MQHFAAVDADVSCHEMHRDTQIPCHSRSARIACGDDSRISGLAAYRGITDKINAAAMPHWMTILISFRLSSFDIQKIFQISGQLLRERRTVV